MLTQPLLDKLSKLNLSAFRLALEEQMQNPQYAELSFEERLGLLVDIETTRRANNRLRRRLKSARFPLQATIEDLDLVRKARSQAGPGPPTRSGSLDRQSSQFAGHRTNRCWQDLFILRLGSGCL